LFEERTTDSAAKTKRAVKPWPTRSRSVAFFMLKRKEKYRELFDSINLSERQCVNTGPKDNWSLFATVQNF
jgi:hypothetical protein